MELHTLTLAAVLMRSCTMVYCYTYEKDGKHSDSWLCSQEPGYIEICCAFMCTDLAVPSVHLPSLTAHGRKVWLGRQSFAQGPPDRVPLH